jgi:hypothetical protein
MAVSREHFAAAALLVLWPSYNQQPKKVPPQALSLPGLSISSSFPSISSKLPSPMKSCKAKKTHPVLRALIALSVSHEKEGDHPSFLQNLYLFFLRFPGL